MGAGRGLRQLKRWRQAGLTELSIGVNVSVMQLLRGNLAAYLRRLLDATACPPTGSSWN
jgi:EAL domain-containing protein (putative c-di-GMP-specific phosphodiesterase class I)